MQAGQSHPLQQVAGATAEGYGASKATAAERPESLGEVTKCREPVAKAGGSQI